MTPEMVVDVGKDAGTVIVLLSAPPLLSGLAIGLTVSLFQAATQIQEMTLSFIPKLIGIGASLIFAGHWMMTLLADFVIRLYHDIPSYIG